MITKEVIETLYKKYRKAPKSPDCLDMPLLFETVTDNHNISVDFDNNRIEIGSVDAKSPFHWLPLDRIHGIVPFDEWVAVVLPAAIVFLNKCNDKVSVHLKPHTDTFMSRLRRSIGID